MDGSETDESRVRQKHCSEGDVRHIECPTMLGVFRQSDASESRFPYLPVPNLPQALKPDQSSHHPSKATNPRSRENLNFHPTPFRRRTSPAKACCCPGLKTYRTVDRVTLNGRPLLVLAEVWSAAASRATEPQLPASKFA